MTRIMRHVPYLALGAIILCACGSFQHTSAWKDRDIAVDGSDKEWKDRMVQHDSLYVGACNDRKDLYLCLTTTEKNLKTQLGGAYGQDFTLWLDPAGKSGKTYGIKFVRAQRPEQRGPKPGAEAQPQGNPGQGTGQAPAADIARIELIKDGSATVPLAQAGGVEAVLGHARGDREFICELKIPLGNAADGAWALPADPGKTIGIVLETSEIKTMEGSGGKNAGGDQRGMARGSAGGPPEGGNNGMGTPPQGDMQRGGGPGGPGGQGGPGGPGGQNTQETAQPMTLRGTITLSTAQ